MHALQDINLRIYKSDVYGIIGFSGAGKSTLIRHLAGLVKPTSGRVLFRQTEISQLQRRSLAEFHYKIGMVFQQFNLFHSKTVGENIAYPLEITRVPSAERIRRVDELLHLVGLSAKKNAHPLSLSGGEKQRVGIARALANHPELILCDEATSALDPKTAQEVLELLKRIHETLGTTIILITHDMEVVKKICNRVAVLESGAIVEEGLIAQIFADPQHVVTRQLIQKTFHTIPDEFFQHSSAQCKLIRLCFKGEAAKEPIISQIVRQYQVDANILLGWIDYIQQVPIGTLVIELTGSEEGIAQALQYLEKKKVHYEVESHAF